MKSINCSFPGIFLGNTLFSYAHARGYAEHHGFLLHTGPWIGQKIFQLDDPPIEQSFQRRTEFNVNEGEGDIEFHTYAQSQKALTYTRSQARSWFKFRPEIEAILRGMFIFSRDGQPSQFSYEWLAHRRLGDYLGYGYPVVSEKSYIEFAKSKGAKLLAWKTEENPTIHPQLAGELKMLPDFWLMMHAENLLRGNSTFSWWASVLGNARTFAPLMNDARGGEVNDTQFVEGNWPAFRADLQFITDLHLAP